MACASKCARGVKCYLTEEAGTKYTIETMERELKRLEDGDLAGIRFVYGAFAMQDAELTRRAGEAVRRQLVSMTDLQMLKLCQRFGAFTSLEWTIDWETVSPDRMQRALSGESYRYVLVLGSFHPNGYFREKCVYVMAGCQGMLFWLFLRMNDWVAQVRDTAGEVLEGYLEECSAKELMESLPAFEHLRAGQRRAESRMQALEERMEEKLSCTLRETHPREKSAMEPAARRALYRIAVRGGLWNLEEMESCLRRLFCPCGKRGFIPGQGGFTGHI